MTVRKGTMTPTKELALDIADQISNLADRERTQLPQKSAELRTDPPQSLAAKLASVMAAIARVPKRGRNDFHGYDYATESDILDAVRHELASRNIVIIPSCEGVERDGDLTITQHRYLITDGTESIERSWFGYGQDKGDKGLYKAYTGAEKYFILKTFLLPTGDDPERDEETPTRKKDLVKAKPLPDDGELRVADVEKVTGKTKAGKPWTKYVVTFSDASKGATFDHALATSCETWRDRQTIVKPLFEAATNPKWDDTLVKCEPEAPTMYYLERVAGKKDTDGNETAPFRLFVKDHDETYVTNDASVADDASKAAEGGCPVAFYTEPGKIGSKDVLWIADFRSLPL